jgi:hypothetical protein
MTLSDFIARVPASIRSKASAATLRTWHCIYCYVTEHGQTDRFDRALDKTIAASLDKWMSDATLQRHLRRMAAAGLLQGHRIVVRYTETGKIWLPFGRMFRNDGLSAGAFIRYTLPGMAPTLDIKKDDEQTTKA